jgi:hypothetical protein
LRDYPDSAAQIEKFIIELEKRKTLETPFTMVSKIVSLRKSVREIGAINLEQFVTLSKNG